MRHKCLVLPVKKLLKSVHIYGSYRKIKTGVPFLLEHPVGPYVICGIELYCIVISVVSTRMSVGDQMVRLCGNVCLPFNGALLNSALNRCQSNDGNIK